MNFLFHHLFFEGWRFGWNRFPHFRCHCHGHEVQMSIFVTQSILDDAGYSDEDEEMDFELPGRMQDDEIIPQGKTDDTNHWDLYTVDELEALLDEAISIEDYGRAAKIRDEN